ncbi:hypothetical protein [Aquimarina latercula]|uniref:hypothetical protein n=1 Tax=Aquimarina latercula TaxID=987 RepID=UPI00040015CF|nr:hypothetical protein [Aquimarina latercula]
MNDITYEEYIRAIRNKYSLQSGGDLSTLLAKPTRANLKKACIEAYDIRRLQSDKRILKQFFDIQNEDGFKIKKEFDNDKFVPIINFLKGKTDSIQSSISLELVAVLIDFKPRPFLEYKRNGNKIIKPPSGSGDGKTKIPWKKITITISFISLVSVLFYLGYNWQQKDCMVWKEDHYESASCNTKGISLNYNQDWVDNFKKAQNDTIETFFKQGDTLYWYYKRNNKVELFTKSGMHPTENVRLKPITETIVRNYILKE